MQKQTDYIGNYIYEDNKLSFILTDKGRIVPDSSGFAYEYFIKDHLGNTRLVVKDTAVISEAHYYPFGMQINALSYTNPLQRVANKYLYNGKELQDDFGLGWLDYGKRFYDAEVPRFTSVDPLAEKYYSISPYAYVANNPLIFIDPNGDTIRVSDAMKKNEQAMKAYNEWTSSKAGKTFIALYKTGGKYGKVSVFFDLETGDDIATNGGTVMYAVNKKTGKETSLTPKRTIEAYKKKGWDVSKYRSSLKPGEYLKARITIDPPAKNWEVKRGLTIVHETQHLRLMHRDLRQYGYIWYSGADQHYFMKEKNSIWYKERFDYYKTKRPDYSNDYIDRIINKFQYGWP